MRHKTHNPGEVVCRLFGSGAVALALCIASLGVPRTTIAQSAQATQEKATQQELEEVVVTGIRASIERSIGPEA